MNLKVLGLGKKDINVVYFLLVEEDNEKVFYLLIRIIFIERVKVSK